MWSGRISGPHRGLWSLNIHAEEVEEERSAPPNFHTRRSGFPASTIRSLYRSLVPAFLPPITLFPHTHPCHTHTEAYALQPLETQEAAMNTHDENKLQRNQKNKK